MFLILDFKKGIYNLKGVIDSNVLFPGVYTLEIFVRQINSPVDLIIDNAQTFKILWKDNTGHKPNYDTISVKGVYTKTKWEISNNEY